MADDDTKQHSIVGQGTSGGNPHNCINVVLPNLTEDDACYTQTVGSRYGISHSKRRRMIHKMEALFPRLIDYQVLKGKLAELTEYEITILCKLTNDLFMNSPACLEVDLNQPIYVVGDIFSQYSDLLRIFITLGWPPLRRYLFLGNYVNRDMRGVETIVLLFLLKVRFPNHVYLLRGCHETEPITRSYGLMEECAKRFDLRLWRELCSSFCHMPVAAIIEGAIFCVHSGLSPTIHNNSKINTQEDLRNFINKNVNRPVEVHRSVLLRHFLWSDPGVEVTAWDQNPNGLGYVFGPDVVKEFCNRFNFQLVVRGNEMNLRGFSFLPGEPRMLTLFTAPNYNGAFKNNGSMIQFKKLRDGSLRRALLLVKPIMKLRGRMTGRMNLEIAVVESGGQMGQPMDKNLNETTEKKHDDDGDEVTIITDDASMAMF